MPSLYIHPQNPQSRLINQALQTLTKAPIIIPTPIGYAIIADIYNKSACHQLSKLDFDRPVLLCQNLADMAYFGELNNAAHRFIKSQKTPAIYHTHNHNTPKHFLDKKTLPLITFATPSNPPIIEAIFEQFGTQNPHNKPAFALLLINQPYEAYELPEIIATMDNGIHSNIDTMIDIGTIDAIRPSVVDITDTPILVAVGDNEPMGL